MVLQLENVGKPIVTIAKILGMKRRVAKNIKLNFLFIFYSFKNKYETIFGAKGLNPDNSLVFRNEKRKGNIASLSDFTGNQ